MNSSNILDRMLSEKRNLPKKQRKLADFIVENYQHIGLLTVAQLAKEAGVGTTTVLRLINSLGYSSFQDFKKEFHDYTIQSSLSTWWHLQKSFSDDHAGPSTQRLDHTLKEIIQLLNQTLNDHLIDNFSKAVHFILNADTLHILGLRTSKVAAIYFENLLAEFYPKTKQLSDSEFLYDRILQFKKGDVLTLISLSPFTTRSIEAAKFCHERGHRVILVTDHLSCPAAPYSDVILKTQASDKQYSIVPTIALLEALVIEIGQQTKNESIQNLEALGELLRQKNITTN